MLSHKLVEKGKSCGLLVSKFSLYFKLLDYRHCKFKGTHLPLLLKADRMAVLFFIDSRLIFGVLLDTGLMTDIRDQTVPGTGSN